MNEPRHYGISQFPSGSFSAGYVHLVFLSHAGISMGHCATCQLPRNIIKKTWVIGMI